jgi:prolyl oligopeptidase
MAQTPPPVAPVENVVDEYFGVRVDDPYRYMEDWKDPKVQAWVKAQADYTTSVLAKIPGRDKLLARIQELNQSAPYIIFGYRREPDGKIYYSKRLADEDVPRFYVRDGIDGQEKLLVDPQKFDGPNGQHASLSFAQPSPDGKKVAFGVALAGSEQTTLHVLDVTSGTLSSDKIDRMEVDYTPPYWLPDSSGFVYSRRRELPPGAPASEGWKLTKSFVHKLGASSDSDAKALAKGLTEAVPLDEVDFPSIVITEGATHAIGKIKHGDLNELTLYAAPAGQLGGADTPWRKVCDVADAVTEFAVHGDDVFLMSWKDAPRFKVIKTSLSNPDLTKAQTLVPESSDSVVDGISVAKDGLYVTIAQGPRHSIIRIGFEPGARPEPIPPPQSMQSASVASASPDVDGILVSTASWTKAGQIYAYDPKAKKLTNTNLKPKGKYDDVEGYESKEVQVKSHDGVMVPLTIIHKKDLKLDGQSPTLISGYGSYGFGSNVNFNPVDLAWLERGGVRAIAHVRGGGEHGKQWHLAGQKLNKPNTWKDFIACAQYLIDNKYTSKEKIAGQGGSAGGILIGRAITERPDLFAAALINVGALDAVRFETTMNGPPNVPEFGSVKTEDGFKGLYAMSAYHQVKNGENYPAVMLTHGVNDPRVDPWMSAKMCARLQSATKSGKPVLFRVDYVAGHGIGSTRTQQEQLTADQWAFLLWQMGDPAFQPQ